MEFERRGIVGHKGYRVERVEPHEVGYANGRHLPFDLLISFPPYVAAMTFSGLPADERGFVAADPLTLQVVGHPEISVVADPGNLPVKQAFLVFLRADMERYPRDSGGRARFLARPPPEEGCVSQHAALWTALSTYAPSGCTTAS